MTFAESMIIKTVETCVWTNVIVSEETGVTMETIKSLISKGYDCLAGNYKGNGSVFHVRRDLTFGELISATPMSRGESI